MKSLIDYLVRECTSVTPVRVGEHTFDKAEVDDLRSGFIEDIRMDLKEARELLADLELEHRERVDNNDPASDLLEEISEVRGEVTRLEAELAEAESFTL